LKKITFKIKSILKNDTFSSVIKNIFWMLLDNSLKIVFGLFVGVWVARYLGPDNFGKINYALAFVTLFASISNLGLNEIIVRDIIKFPNKINVLIGTTFLLKFFAAALTVFISIVLALFFFKEDQDVIIISIILSFTLIFKSADVIKSWNESQLKVKHSVIIENIVFTIMTLLKILVITYGLSYLYIVWITLFESILVFIFLLYVYNYKDNKLTNLAFDYSEAKRLLRDSWPLMFSSLAIMIYMKIDQIMLGKMIGNKGVGDYTAALRISEIWYMFPMLIVTSVFPKILESKQISTDNFNKKVKFMFDILINFSILISILITLFSNKIIYLFYGSTYLYSSPILQIHIWASVFVFMGVASSKLYMIDNLQKVSMYRTFFGAGLNIILNIFLIPKFQGIGAAWATVISYSFVAYFLDFFNYKTRYLFYIKTKSLFTFPNLIFKLKSND